MRKGFAGLSGLVRQHISHDLMSGEVFIFINRRRDRIKLLMWDRTGFALYYKQLEKGTFEHPISTADSQIEMDASESIVINLRRQLLIDNNAIENKIRSIVLGRENYLFAGLHFASQRFAEMHSIFVTWKAQDVNPYEWLGHTPNHIAYTNMTDLNSLVLGDY